MASRERLRCGLAMAVLIAGHAGFAQHSLAQSSGGKTNTPVRLTADEDHRRLMDLLHIASLRQGPSGDPKAPDAANVDESKVPLSSLPDPLTLKSGKRVADAKTWWKVRRPEIVEDFDREIFGRAPKETPKGEVGGH